MTKPTVKVVEIAFARLQAPDLDKMEEFLTEFGMFKSARTDTALYMRGTDPSHHLHVTHKGEPGFISFAYRVSSEDDLTRRKSRRPGQDEPRRPMAQMQTGRPPGSSAGSP